MPLPPAMRILTKAMLWGMLHPFWDQTTLHIRLLLIPISYYSNMHENVTLAPPSSRLCSSEEMEMVVEGGILLNYTIGKETDIVEFIKGSNGVWGFIVSTIIPHNTKAILYFSEDTFICCTTDVMAAFSLPRESVHDVCNALFEATGKPRDILKDLCEPHNHVSNNKMKNFRDLLSKHGDIFELQGSKQEAPNVVVIIFESGEARLVLQPLGYLPHIAGRGVPSGERNDQRQIHRATTGPMDRTNSSSKRTEIGGCAAIKLPTLVSLVLYSRI
ncbi:hypothetical protein EGR_11302 [Echinococcus granulosus]|uniref:Uncharacterized protein n=1 Tax=Echinococcus granulosus TaxID=6210 RepID=W6U686_ECHGR|nr:hypothetical protein EGR_11302 [Echinococcus granulosus]EUB53847.1 hypothetical protein EGR_11302 [Echinococcus granulosus]